MKDPGPLVGIDVGAASVSVVVAEAADDHRTVVLGCGRARHAGAPKGIVADLEAVTEAVRLAAEEAEAMASAPVERAVVGLGGPAVRGLNARSSVPVTGARGLVSDDDRDRALERCTRFAQPSDYTVLDVIPREFVLDGQPGVRRPVGMPATRLDAHAHVLYAHRTHAESVLKAVNQAGIVAERLYFEPLAAAAAALTPDERELGCLLVDIGHGGTEWALYAEEAVVATGCFPVGGRSFTNDLAVILRTSSHAAEELKRRHGLAGADGTAVEVPALGGEGQRVVPLQVVTETLAARAKEVLVAVHRQLAEEQLDGVARAGVVLTGGGALLPGLGELAEAIFGARARLGAPRGIEGEVEPVAGPEWAVAVGLVRLQAAWRRSQGDRRRGSGPLGWLRQALGELFEMGGGP